MFLLAVSKQGPMIAECRMNADGFIQSMKPLSQMSLYMLLSIVEQMIKNDPDSLSNVEIVVLPPTIKKLPDTARTDRMKRIKEDRRIIRVDS